MGIPLFTFSMAPLFTFSMKTKARRSALHFHCQGMDELRTESPIVKSFSEEVRTEPPSSTPPLTKKDRSRRWELLPLHFLIVGLDEGVPLFTFSMKEQAMASILYFLNEGVDETGLLSQRRSERLRLRSSLPP